MTILVRTQASWRRETSDRCNDQVSEFISVMCCTVQCSYCNVSNVSGWPRKVRTFSVFYPKPHIAQQRHRISENLYKVSNIQCVDWSTMSCKRELKTKTPLINAFVNYSTPVGGAEYCGQPVCLCVSLSARISLEPLYHRHEILCDFLWPWLGPPPAALRYVMYFRLDEWRHVWP